MPLRPYEQPPTNWPADAVGRGSLPADLAAWRAFYRVEAPDPSVYYSGDPTIE